MELMPIEGGKEGAKERGKEREKKERENAQTHPQQLGSDWERIQTRAPQLMANDLVLMGDFALIQVPLAALYWEPMAISAGLSL